ncbi:endopolygalacturonase [Listeria weihenstephanensis FSL R9-0317]|uniref:Pectate lyase superfamily protein domain-containing protein n=1 Tax=Listeria weihenstephanensis TaxID=1006155 RepID=A0A1S7FRR2_9LIST|nr:hypothetical protein [Listeria weihenstephanensis]AQY50104.1 hypothetical protein UE46_02930 [Listeria weihenstephanensis]EUJ34541.1 endopolygalacturonase [Listeria weihenstephanensis FSL R9-0317]
MGKYIDISQRKMEKYSKDTDYNKTFEDALREVKEANGGVIYVPTGVYEILPTTDFPLCSNLTITGDGPQSVIKIKGTVRYQSIFGQENVDERLENVYFEKFAIDQNQSNNTSLPGASNGVNYYHLAFSLQNFSNVHFRKLEFRSASGVNAISCDGSDNRLCRDVTVEHCRFYREAKKTMENSAIYINAVGSNVSNNKFYAFGKETIQASRCIEVRGGKGVITGNYSEGYATGAAVSNRLNEKSDILVTGNTFTKAKKGIQLMVNHPKDGTSGVDWTKEADKVLLDGVVISANTISIDVSDFESKKEAYYGISFTGVADGNRWLQNIKVATNNINFTGKSGSFVDIEAGYSVMGSSLYSAYGVIFKTPINNISVTDNIISKVPFSSIYFNKEATSVNLNSNVLTNCAYGEHGLVAKISFIDVLGKTLGASIQGNLISDQFEVAKAENSITVSSASNKDIFIRSNLLATKQENPIIQKPVEVK